LKRIPIKTWPHLKRAADTSQACVLAGRILILFIALLLMAMPWTEHFCNIDRFLRGGQDVEFSLLAFAAVLSLILLLSQRHRQGMTALLSLLYLLPFIVRPAHPVAAPFSGLVVLGHNRLVPCRAFNANTLPLLI
jgi:cytochrome bd-type quinol oxidase subunit 2